MAVEGTYDYECMRAELLGIEKPDYDEFVKNKAEKEAVELEAAEAESLREVRAQKEDFQQIGGKLTELNNILKSTQKKINTFTAPFSKFLKSRMGMSSSTTKDTRSVKEDPLKPPDSSELESDSEGFKEPPPPKKIDVEYPLATEKDGRNFNPNNMPVIDDLIDKYDRAQVDMEHQNKQMKRFLK